ncbi:MAG: tetratricopeptide repeat protein, partial [Halobacteriaceae archaeon]
FEEPYEGFDLDPPELDVDTSEVDPVDSRVITDLLDDHHLPEEEVDIEELIDVGLNYMGINRYEQAVDAFERAARFAPEDSAIEQEAWVNKGVAHAELEEYDEAIGAYQEALRIDETNLAYALWEHGEDEKAFQHAEEAVKKDQRLPQAWYNLGFIEAERGLYEDALDCMNKALKLGFRNASIYEEKARILEELGQEEKAQQAMEQANEIREETEEELVYDR